MAYKRTNRRHKRYSASAPYTPSSSAQVHLSEDSNFFEEKSNSERCTVRMYYYTKDDFGNDCKPFWKGKVFLANGQVIFISVGGQFVNHETKNGNKYFESKVVLTV